MYKMGTPNTIDNIYQSIEFFYHSLLKACIY